MNYIMISGHKEKHIQKIDKLDGVIMLNLEDGVPQDKKKFALENIINYLKTNPKKEIVVRVNTLNEGGIEEIKALKEFNVSFRIPKVNNLEDLDEILYVIDNEIHLSIETKESFFNLKTLNHPQITTFYLGILDLFAELKLSHSIIKLTNPFIHNILTKFSLETLYLNVKPVGFVYQNYKDLDGFRKWCEMQKEMGLKGVGCITPAQLEVANEVFSEDLEFAKIVVERFEREGTFSINGLFVDEPIYKNYKNIMKNN